MGNSNFHSHCTFCDGQSHPENFIQFAISKGFRAYGFSSHSPIPFETFWNMSLLDVPEYITEIQRLKNKYDGIIEIYLGMEIDFLDKTYNAAIPFFQTLPLDYRISAIHFLACSPTLSAKNMVCIDGAYRDFEVGLITFFDGNIRRMVEYCFESSMLMVETGGFDVVGHIDKIYMNASKHPDFDLQASWYQKPFLQLLDLIAEKGLIVEINCKNLPRKRLTYPHITSFKELKKREIPVIVSSDCHEPHLINAGRSEAIALLKEAGYNTTRELVKGTWQEVSLLPL